MIVGIGVDLCDTERVRELIAKWGERFERRVFTDRERSYCRNDRRRHECLGGRFAAKEAALKAIGAPIPQVKFCPTGGVSLANAPEYLALSNTLCVGGSWVAPKDKVISGDWAGITALAAQAALLGAG